MLCIHLEEDDKVVVGLYCMKDLNDNFMIMNWMENGVVTFVSLRGALRTQMLSQKFLISLISSKILDLIQLL